MLAFPKWLSLVRDVITVESSNFHEFTAEKASIYCYHEALYSTGLLFSLWRVVKGEASQGYFWRDIFQMIRSNCNVMSKTYIAEWASQGHGEEDTQAQAVLTDQPGPLLASTSPVDWLIHSLGLSYFQDHVLSTLLSIGTHPSDCWNLVSGVRNCSVYPASYVTGQQRAMNTMLRESNLGISVHLFKEMLMIFSLQSGNTLLHCTLKATPKA